MRQQAAAEKINIPQFTASADKGARTPENRSTRRRWITLLLASFFVAAATGITGIALAAASLFHLAALGGKVLLLSQILIAATFAALIFGAHCLDRIDAVEHDARVIRFKEKLREISDAHGGGFAP